MIKLPEQQDLDLFIVGELVRVTGLRGTFRVTGKNKDGSVAVYGGASVKESHRSFTADRLRRIKERK